MILLAAVLVAAAVAAPVGALCVRYVKIYFGMLTLAFGMLFYTFLLKFYHLTGGDEGMRVPPAVAPRPRPAPSSRRRRTWSGPYYYYSLAVLVLAAALMWRIVHSPFGLCLRTIRDNPLKAESLGLSRAPLSLVRLRDLRRLRRRSAASSWRSRPATSTRRSPTGPTPATSCS